MEFILPDDTAIRPYCDCAIAGRIYKKYL